MLFLRVRPMPGDDLLDLLREAKVLATRNGCGVEFDFHDRRVQMLPENDVEELWQFLKNLWHWGED